VPPELHADTYSNEDDWMSRGQSVIIAPGGDVLAGPLVEQEGILCAEIGPDRAGLERRECDPSGHYARPDVSTCTLTPLAGTRSPSTTTTTSPRKNAG
jgi:nitrilase